MVNPPDGPYQPRAPPYTSAQIPQNGVSDLLSTERQETDWMDFSLVPSSWANTHKFSFLHPLPSLSPRSNHVPDISTLLT